MNKKQISIQGIRGVPAEHGGFETFAENLAVYLVKNGWHVTVYCQESTLERNDVYESNWQGVKRIHIPVKGEGAKSTIIFDYLSIKNASKQSGIVLTLGYNTGIFNLLFRLKGKNNIINMDGIEWKRDKWKWHEKTWLYLNERASCLIGNHLVADHPEIKNHLTTRIANSKVSMIPYGAREVVTADPSLLKIFNIELKKYAIIIARAEPENSILEIVQAFSYSSRDIKLVVLGKYDEGNLYHSSVLSAASNQVEFIGAVYDHTVLDALRFYSVLYIHGHTVGGTNPSLIEALGSGQPILAHNNKFNRWVAGDNAVFFKDKIECQFQLDSLLNNPQRLEQMSEFSRKRFNERFTWSNVLGQYENLLNKWL